MSERYLQPEVHIVITQTPGVDGIASPARLTQIETDLATMLSRPTILSFDDIPNVNLAGAAEGNAVVYNASDDEWIPGGIQEGIRVRGPEAPVEDNATDITFWSGLLANHSEASGRTYVVPLYGTTGNTIAAGNHTHVQPLPVKSSSSPSGYMSGGSQPLGSIPITVASGTPYVVEAELYGQFRGADEGAAYYILSITIDGDTYASGGGTDGFWCVQGVPDKIYWTHDRRLTGTGSAITVSASVSWHSGAGFYIDRTFLKVTVRTDR